MARGRFISKEISYDGKVGALCESGGAEAALFFTWLIAHLDREGRQHGDPAVLKGIICPLVKQITPDKIRKILEIASDLSLITWYEHAGQKYVALPNFSKHQTGMRKEREAASRLPDPSICLESAPKSVENKELRSNSGVDPDLVRSYSGKNPVKYKYKDKYKDKEKIKKLNKKSFDAAELVADYYRERNPGRGRALRAGHKDFKLIESRLAEGFSVDELKQAVDGNLIDEWHVENGNHSAQYVFRNTTKVENFINRAKQGPRRETKGWLAATERLIDEQRAAEEQAAAAPLRLLEGYGDG